MKMFKTTYEFAFDLNGSTKVGSYQDAIESGSSHIAAVKVVRNGRGKEVSRDQFIARDIWVENDADGYENAIAARNIDDLVSAHVADLEKQMSDSIEASTDYLA